VQHNAQQSKNLLLIPENPANILNVDSETTEFHTTPARFGNPLCGRTKQTVSQLSPTKRNRSRMI
jgi:hypothetical protein